MARSAKLLLCGLWLVFFTTVIFAQAVPHLSKDQASHTEPVHTDCSTYRKIAAATPAGRPAPSSTTYRNVISPSGPPRVALLETPSNTIWVPHCKNNSNGWEGYERTQHRLLNNQPFCVFENTGEIIFDPFRTEKGRSAAMPVTCDCFGWAAAYDSASHDPGYPRPQCDPHTGDFKGGRPAYFPA